MCFIKSPLRDHLGRKKKKKRKARSDAEQWHNVHGETFHRVSTPTDWCGQPAAPGKQSAPAVCTYFLSVNNGTQTQPLPPSPALHPSFTLLCPSHFSIHTLFSQTLAARWLPEKLSPVAQTPRPCMRQMNSINGPPQTQLLIFCFVLDF